MKFTRRKFLVTGAVGVGSAAIIERGYDYATDSSAKGNVVIVGGGAAGITVAAYLADWLPKATITLIEPNDSHHYQPGYTLIAAGVFTPDAVVRPTQSLMPGSVKWIKDTVQELAPGENYVTTSANGKVSYDFLVLAPGCQMNFNLIEGVSRETLGEGNVHCIYDYQGAIRARDAIAKLQESKGGRLVFSNTYTKLKCGGAPKKVCLFTEDGLRTHGLREKFEITYYTNEDELMTPPVFGDRLKAIFAERTIGAQYRHRLMSVDTAAKKAVFAVLKEVTQKAITKEEAASLITVDYDLLHIVPPMSAPDFVRNSPIAGDLSQGGWAATDKDTLVQTKFKNIVVLGDVAGIPTSKTAAAIRVQAPIAAANLVSLMEGKEPKRKYNGYTACPIITKYGKVLMCEFGYDKVLMPTVPGIDPAVDRKMWWDIKVHGLKPMYFDLMLKGLV